MEQLQQPQKEPPVLGPGRWHTQEYARMHFVVDIAQGHTKDDLLVPAYWALHAKQMTPLSLIETRAEDGSFWGLLLVLACDRTWAKVHPVLWCDLTTADVSLTESLKTGYLV